MKRLDEHGWLEVPCERSWSFRIGGLVLTVWRPGWMPGCAPWEQVDVREWTAEELAALERQEQRNSEWRRYWGITS